MPTENQDTTNLLGGDEEAEITSSRKSATGSTTKNEIIKDNQRAWCACFAGYTIQIIIQGFLHIWGIFLLPLTASLNTTTTHIAWAGSATIGLSMILGPVCGLLIKKLGKKVVVLVGCLSCGLSLLLTSFIRDVNLIYVTFTVMYGAGSCLAYTPIMTIAQDYFDKYLSIATGIMTAGSSTGTLVLTPVTNALIYTIGWRNTMRFCSGLTLIAATCTLVFQSATKPAVDAEIPSLPPRSLARNIIEELSIWNNRVFIVWSLAVTLVMFGYYVPYVHLVAYAESIGIPASKASNIIMVLGGCTTVGRVIFGKLVSFECLDRLRMHQLSMIVTGTALVMLPSIKSFEGVMAYVAIVGFADGCFFVLLPLMTATLIGNDKAVMAWAFVVGAASVTSTLGPPIAGLVVEKNGSYDYAFRAAAVPIFMGAIVLLFIPWAIRTSHRLSAISTTAIPPLDELENLDEDLLMRLSIIATDIMDDSYIQPARLSADIGSLKPGVDADSNLATGSSPTPNVQMPQTPVGTSSVDTAVNIPSASLTPSFLSSKLGKKIESDIIMKRRVLHYQNVIDQYKRIMASRSASRARGRFDSISTLTGGLIQSSSLHGKRPGRSRSYESGKKATPTRSLEQAYKALKVSKNSSWLLDGYQQRESNTKPSCSTSLKAFTSDTDNFLPLTTDPDLNVEDAKSIKKCVDDRIEATLQHAENAPPASPDLSTFTGTDPLIASDDGLEMATIPTNDERVTIVPGVDLTKLPNVDPTKVLTLVVDVGQTSEGQVDAEKLASLELSKMIVGLDVNTVGETDIKPVSLESKTVATEAQQIEEIVKTLSAADVAALCDVADRKEATDINQEKVENTERNIYIVPILPKPCPSPVELCTTVRKKVVTFKEAKSQTLPKIVEDDVGESQENTQQNAPKAQQSSPNTQQTTLNTPPNDS